MFTKCTKNSHITLTMTLTSFPTVSWLSWLGLKKNSTDNVLFRPFYKLAVISGTKCFFSYPNTKTDKLKKFFVDIIVLSFFSLQDNLNKN